MDNITDGSKAPFGIHNICLEGKKSDIKPGQWYGPHMISIVLKNICNQYNNIPGFKMHVCVDSNIFLDEIEAFVKKGLSVFVMIPLRLGINSISNTYLEQLKYIFQIYNNVGIAGGKDHMALYLIGDEDRNNPKSGLFYLDPHFVQNAVPKAEADVSLDKMNLAPYLHTYHCKDLRMLSMSEMCTSMAPGFYIRDEEMF